MTYANWVDLRPVTFHGWPNEATLLLTVADGSCWVRGAGAGAGGVGVINYLFVQYGEELLH